MRRVSIFLVMVALIAGIVSCGGESYTLASASTEGGSVITPGEGMFTYDEGTVVNLAAEADEGYYFVNWAGDVDSIDNVEAAITTITMDGDYSVVADFGGDSCNITQVAAGGYHTVGVESDGTVVAVGENEWGQCNVGGWTDIIQVTAGLKHTVGVKSDGTAVTVGLSSQGQCDVGDWMTIVQVAAGWYHTVGLKYDGTVVAVGDNYHGPCDVDGWDLN